MSKLREPNPDVYDSSHIIISDQLWKLIAFDLLRTFFLYKNNRDWFYAPLFGNSRKIFAEY